MKKFTHPLEKKLLDARNFEKSLKRINEKKTQGKNAKDRGPVIKNLSLSWINENKPSLLKTIIQSIQKDNFDYSLLKLIKLQTNEKVRDIYLSNYADRMILMSLQDIIAEAIDDFHHANLFSFRKKMGPKVAAQRLSAFLKSKAESENIFFLGRDVTSYGDSIDHQVMDKVIDDVPQLEGAQLVKTLLKKSYRCEFYLGDNPECSARMIRGIPSGSPVVPLLENLYLASLDKKLSSLPNSFYARYGDDFIFLTTDEKTALVAMELINKEITHLRVSISERKIKNYVLGNKINNKAFKQVKYFEWIGITFYQNGQYSFRPKHKKQYQQRLRTEAGNTIYHISKSALSREQAVECINIGFQYFNNLSELPEVQKMIVLRTHIQNTKNLDKASREFLVRTIAKNFKIRKKEAWKLFRKMKLHSLEYHRRRLKCNQAA